MQKNLTTLLEYTRDLPGIQSLFSLLSSQQNAEITGAVGSLKSIIIAHLFKKIQRPILWLFENQENAVQAKEDLEHLISVKDSALFPLPRKSKWGHDDLIVLTQQAEILQALTHQQAQVYLASHTATWARLRSPKKLFSQTINIRPNGEVNFDQFIKKLLEMGFEREPTVEKPGDIAVRGGIVDVFPFTVAHPLRIEFWGNQIESIREFDAQTQRSILPVHRTSISPRPNPGQESAQATLLEYLPGNTIVVFNDIAAIEKFYTSEQNSRYFDENFFDLSNSHPDEFWQEFLSRFHTMQQVYMAPIKTRYTDGKINFSARHLPPLQGDLKQLIQEFRKNIQENQGKNFFLCESAGHGKRMEELFLDRGLAEHEVTITSLSLHQGFRLPHEGIFVYTDHQFYGRIRRQKVRRKFRYGLTLRQLKTLSIGDFVVHTDHGIGVFRGLAKIKIRENERECLLLEYRHGDKLYVPLDKMDRVQKYTGRDGFVPAINKLGAPDWQRLKKRTKAKAKEIAKELLHLYALRKTEAGFAFSPDTTWQKELEASFIYEDTPDQLQATQEVKKDMEKEQPMDRLICGDVGYGKTEVAVRAAFKAVQDGKQVAMLVPTTILAEQHYFTFLDRLGKFPVQIDVLSRFRSAKEQKQIVAKIKNGEIDILIGTHRLLSKDIEFKNLGLLIIDEEQRFGVRHKERLKQLRVHVDVLTLSATPIPRTLQMSLLGVRDMSQINTPPRDRLPIHTEVVTFDKEFVRQAILREVERGGQVFFVHNRIKSIYLVARRIANLVPEVDIAVAHGQMKEKDLEMVMMDFMNQQYHVLVTTMIIESGLDIPNVNTIFINRADRFGLAQLYQLRGRVGRSSHKAFCYLIIPPVRSLTPEAIRRLETIEEYTDLGSGMQIAMRDLEIRGAGNILGAEQSGFMDAMGYDTYMKILAEAVNELRAKEIPEAHQKPFLPDECKIDANVDAYLPQKYVEAASDRVDIYRRLAHVRDIQEINAVQEEVRDRFGRLPREAENLFNLTKLRVLGRLAGLTKISVTERLVVGYFTEKLYNQSGDFFKNWLGRIVSRSCKPIEFMQQKGLGMKVHFNQDEDSLKGLVELVAEWVDGSTDEQIPA